MLNIGNVRFCKPWMCLKPYAWYVATLRFLRFSYRFSIFYLNLTFLFMRFLDFFSNVFNFTSTLHFLRFSHQFYVDVNVLMVGLGLDSKTTWIGSGCFGWPGSVALKLAFLAGSGFMLLNVEMLVKLPPVSSHPDLKDGSNTSSSL